MEIPGYPIMIGDGLRFTTDDGSSTIAEAGYGFPILSGDRHGLAGEAGEVITDGHLLARAYRSISILVRESLIFTGFSYHKGPFTHTDIHGTTVTEM